MDITRRDFVKTSAIGAAGLLAYKASLRSAYAFYQSTGVNKFVSPMRGRDTVSLVTEIGVAGSDRLVDWGAVKAQHYTIGIQQFTDQLGYGTTKLWGWVPANYFVAAPPGPRHLGGVIVAEKGTPVQITFRNNLPPTHIIPVDTTLPGANQAQNRVAAHLHGGFIPWISDGGPFDWFAPNGTHGLSFLNNVVLNPGAAPNEAEYYYPNNQSARLMWYHDHAFGITRINAYAGIASAYIIRDNFERGLVDLGLPNFVEAFGYEIPLVFQDKIFVNNANITALDPSWPGPKDTGSLWYAHTYERARWALGPGLKLRMPVQSCIPEFFGDTMLVNGTIAPELHVEPRRYRLRILNACNARFLNLQLYKEDPANPGSIAFTAPNPADPIYVYPNTAISTPGPNVLQIGTEGGFMPKAVAVPMNVPFTYLPNPTPDSRPYTGSLIMGPAERADVIIDFSGLSGNYILYTDAPAPFPSGDPLNDYFNGRSVAQLIGTTPPPALLPGKTPDTRNLLRIVVDLPLQLPADAPLGFGTTTDLTTLDFTTTAPTVNPAPYPYPPTNPVWNEPLLVDLGPNGTYTLKPGVTVARTRRLTLNEDFDAYGRLIQIMGTDVKVSPSRATYGRTYLDPVTERVPAGTVEIWEVFNTTGDVHPIHFHLVNLQILNRETFNLPAFNLTGVVNLIPGTLTSPDPNETGWKETIRMNPGEVIRMITKFDLPAVPFAVPQSPRTGGYEYVYHCHILEHEEHDMMRPLVVV